MNPERVIPLPDWAIGHAECEVLARLRAIPAIFESIAQAAGSEFQRQKALRAAYDEDLVRHALTLADLRQRAAAKFTCAQDLWLDRQGLEQATSEVVARYKAQRFAGSVWDLCSGIGSDAAAIAEHGDVLAFDNNPASCLRSLWNAEVWGRQGRVAVECRDVTELDVTGQLVHIDPDRRPGAGSRMLRVEDYVPGLEVLHRYQEQARGGAIKLSPASNFGGKFHNCEVELISLGGECKEATIWFGELAGTAPYRATVLPAGLTLAGHPLDVLAERSTLGTWIYDPDPAVVRAGLVDLLAETLGLRRLDEAEEYLTGDHHVDSPFVQGFEVLESLPNQEKEIRQALRRREFGQLEIKCRHIPIAASELRRRLPLTGKRPGVLLFVREQGKARAVIAQRPAAQ